MALVSYDYDSTSEVSEDEEVIESPIVIEGSSTTSVPQNDSLPPQKEILDEVNTPNTIFTSLPKIKTFVKDLVEDKIEDFVPKSKPIQKDKQKVKITIPSLSDFNDIEDEEPQTKKQKQSIKGSGLISLLPPVKGSHTTTKSFIPNIVNKKKNNQTSSTAKSNAFVPNVIRKKSETNKKIHLKKKQLQGSDVESDDDIEIPETFDDEMWQKICGRPKSKPVVQKLEPPQEETVNIAPEPEEPYSGLDNEAFKELVGRNKRPIGNIKLIDINEEEIVAEKDLWISKSLTDPQMAPKATVEDPVDPTRRKKHHITYLAQQAKANEQELQNAWAASKNNRLASRAKYGF